MSSTLRRHLLAGDLSGNDGLEVDTEYSASASMGSAHLTDDAL